MGKEIGRSYKYNLWKVSTPTLKKPVSSSSDSHTSSSSNLTGISISSQLGNKDILPIKIRARTQIRMTSIHV